MPLDGLGDHSLEGSGAASSGHSVVGPEGKEKKKEKEAVDMGVEEEDPRDEHEPSDEVPFNDTPVESTPSASDYHAVPSPTNHDTPSHKSRDMLTHNHSTYG